MADGVEELRDLAFRLLEKLETDQEAVHWIVSRLADGEYGNKQPAIERLRIELLLGPAAQIVNTIDHARGVHAVQSPPPKRGGQPKERRRDYHPKFEVFAEDLFRSALSAGVRLTLNRNAMAKYEGTFVKAIRALMQVVPAGVVPHSYPDKFALRGLESIAKRVMSNIANREKERQQNHAEPGMVSMPARLVDTE